MFSADRAPASTPIPVPRRLRVFRPMDDCAMTYNTTGAVLGCPGIRRADATGTTAFGARQHGLQRSARDPDRGTWLTDARLQLLNRSRHDGSDGEIDSERHDLHGGGGRIQFNMELAELGGTGRPSPELAYASAAVHNPFMTEAAAHRRASTELEGRIRPVPAADWSSASRPCEPQFVPGRQSKR